MIYDNIQIPFRDVFPFILGKGQFSSHGSRVSYDHNDVRVAGLHSSGRRGIFIPGKVFCINDSDDGVESEIATSVLFELAYLKGQSCWKCRAAEVVSVKSLWLG